MKHFFSLLLLLCLSSPLAAQGWVFGMKGGYNLAWQTFPNNPNRFGAISAYTVGLFADRGSYTRKVRFTPELLYQRQGVRIGGSQNQRFTYDYLMLPLLMELNPGEPLFLRAGLYGSRMLLAREVFGQDANSIPFQVLDVNPWDLGFTAGVGVRFLRRFRLEGRYGLSILSQDPTQTIRNQFFQVTTGITF